MVNLLLWISEELWIRLDRRSRTITCIRGREADWCRPGTAPTPRATVTVGPGTVKMVPGLIQAGVDQDGRGGSTEVKGKKNTLTTDAERKVGTY